MPPSQGLERDFAEAADSKPAKRRRRGTSATPQTADDVFIFGMDSAVSAEASWGADIVDGIAEPESETDPDVLSVFEPEETAACTMLLAGCGYLS